MDAYDLDTEIIERLDRLKRLHEEIRVLSLELGQEMPDEVAAELGPPALCLVEK